MKTKRKKKKEKTSPLVRLYIVSGCCLPHNISLLLLGCWLAAKPTPPLVFVCFLFSSLFRSIVECKATSLRESSRGKAEFSATHDAHALRLFQEHSFSVDRIWIWRYAKVARFFAFPSSRRSLCEDFSTFRVFFRSFLECRLLGMKIQSLSKVRFDDFSASQKCFSGLFLPCRFNEVLDTASGTWKLCTIKAKNKTRIFYRF